MENGNIQKAGAAAPDSRFAIIISAAVAVFALGALVVDFFAAKSPALMAAEAALIIIAGGAAIFGIYKSKGGGSISSAHKEEFKSLSANLDDALIIYDDDFKVILFNAAAEELFKVKEADVMGHVLTPQDVERDGWRMLTQTIFPSLAPRVVLLSGDSGAAQVSDISFTDPAVELRVTSVPIANSSGARTGFMKIIHNRTSEIAALRSRSEFVTVASHQLRTPVTELRWALQSLAHEEGLSPTGKEIVQNALSSAESMLRRIEGMLNISRMEEGKFGYKFEETDILEFIAKFLADVLPLARGAGVKLYFDRPSEELPKVMIDPNRFTIALTNLLENAIRYNVESGEVVLKVDQVPGKPFLEVSVKDTGIGVPAEAMSKLFTKFYRADNAMKAQADGSGLGLYMTKNIVAAHGGEIWAESELGRGTTFHFTIPTDPNLVPQHEAAAMEMY